MYVLQTKSSLSAQFDFVVAIPAIHGSTFTRLKRDFSFFATLSTNRREHLTIGRPIAVATISVPLCFPCLTAFGATLGLISIVPRLEKLLFLYAKGEFIPAVGTFERLVLKRHWMTSSLNYLVRVLATQYMRKTVKFNPICDNQSL
ncbi:hypothetical protein ES703_101405 [subsurface metagenome]